MPEEQDAPIFEPDTDGSYKVVRGDEHIADVVWREGDWFLSRVDGETDEKLDQASGKDDVHAALEQATRLLSD
jgi:hypothetical protein